jgi:hypothetical protein
VVSTQSTTRYKGRFFFFFFFCNIFLYLIEGHVGQSSPYSTYKFTLANSDAKDLVGFGKMKEEGPSTDGRDLHLLVQHVVPFRAPKIPTTQKGEGGTENERDF